MVLDCYALSTSTKPEFLQLMYSNHRRIIICKKSGNNFLMTWSMYYKIRQHHMSVCWQCQPKCALECSNFGFVNAINYSNSK